MTGDKYYSSQSLIKKFHKQRDVETFKQADNIGYFFNPTKEALLLQCKDQNSQQNDIENFKLLCLTGIHLRVLGDIVLCSKLSICLLANNFISKIDALVVCQNLVKLDLHSNELVALPGFSFWENLDKLQVLHLHDNPLGDPETIQILSCSPCLSILTLYDTPLSLRNSYRHHAVNSIWSLKALDMYVISDEEIIEDAVFASERFTALSPVFRLDLSPRTSSNSTFAQEMSVYHSLIAKVNSILARHSPVIILQRFLRGYLVRRKMGIIKKWSSIKSVEFMPHPPSISVSISPAWTTFAGEVVDYDSYMRKWRPGSVVPDETLKILQHCEQGSTMERESSSQEDEYLHINIQKLNSGILSGLQTDTVAMESAFGEKESLGLASRKKTGKIKRGKKEKDNKPKQTEIKNKKFFRPVVPTLLPSDDENDTTLVDFRLKGRKPDLLIADATTEMILSRKEAGQMVREAETEIMRRNFMQSPIPVKSNHFTTAKQRLFNKAYGTMGLSCLMAVHKAYAKREKDETAAARTENTSYLREERQQGKDNINRYCSEHRTKVLKSRHLDRSQALEVKQKQEFERINSLDKIKEYKVRLSDFSQVFKADHSFMHNFSCQQTSVSNALLRFDHQTYSEDQNNRRQTYVSNIKKTKQEQQDGVKKYLEHRKLMRQADAAKLKADINIKLQTGAKERMMEARNRVAQQKSRQVNIIDFYSLSYNTMSHTKSAPMCLSIQETDSEL